MLQVRTETLTAPPGFSLKATALSHGWHECAPMSWCEGGACFQLIERIGDEPFRVCMTENGRASNRASLRVTIEGRNPDDGCVARLLPRVRDVLSLDRDLTEFYTLCERHPRLKLVPRIGGGRLIRSASMFENIVKFLCSTNVNWTQAVKMINRLSQLGPHLPHFRSQNAWPTPAEILRAGESYLKDICRVGYRAESILAFCKAVDRGHFDPEPLAAECASESVSTDDLVRRLKQIKGIGPASAHGLLSMLGRYDYVSIDSATIAHAAAVHFHGRKPSPREVEKVYEPYGKWKNLVYWCESWITWGTARELIRDAGLAPPKKSERPPKPKTTPAGDARRRR